MSNIKFSILCPCYNHEKYIIPFIKSALAQTYNNFELIIVDDCSSDSTVNKILEFNDERIKLIRHKFNMGINSGINDAFKKSLGEYIVLCASDDIMEPNILEKYFDLYNSKDIDAIYTNLSVIDEEGQLREDFNNSSLPEIENKSKEYLLHRAFMSDNPLYSPGFSCKRKCLESLYPLPASLSITQDYKINIDILLKYNIEIIKDKLVRYRIARTNQQNISAPSPHSISRYNIEMSFVMDSFLSINNTEALKKIFIEEIQITKIIPYPDTIKFFLGQMALLSKYNDRKKWGYTKILEAYNESINNNILYNRYKFTYKDLLNIAKQISTNVETHKYSMSIKNKIFSITKTLDKIIIYFMGFKISLKHGN